MTHSPSSAQSGLSDERINELALLNLGYDRAIRPLDFARAIEREVRAAASARPIGEDAANVAMGEREAFEAAFRSAHEFPEQADQVEFLKGWQAGIMFARAALTAEKVAGQDLAVWYGSMPESNGKTNWTAILHNGDLASGITLNRSEYPDRVRYVADQARWLIGELDKEPFILDYDADKHSGYVAPQQPAQPVAQTTGDTGNPEADRIIGRLSSSDPDFDDCAYAVAFIHKLVVEHKGPDGFATWKDAAIDERMRRVNLEDAAHRYQSCRASAIERGLFSSPEEYDAMVDDSLRKKGKEVLTGRGHNYGKKVATDGSLYRPQPAAKTASPCNDALFASVTDWMNAHCIPFEAQNELFRILAASATWEALFDRVALELNCLPSSFVDGNDHVFCAIEKLRGEQPVAQTLALTDEQREAVEYAVRWMDENVSNRYVHTAAKALRSLLAAQPASSLAEGGERE